MENLKTLKALKEKVLWELENRPKTRASDKILTIRIYEDFYGVRPSDSWIGVMSDFRLPSIESIGRARRRVQENRIDLRAEEPVESARIEIQKDYIEFSKGEE